jgi:hypothetical protein
VKREVGFEFRTGTPLRVLRKREQRLIFFA